MVPYRILRKKSELHSGDLRRVPLARPQKSHPHVEGSDSLYSLQPVLAPATGNTGCRVIARNVARELLVNFAVYVARMMVARRSVSGSAPLRAKGEAVRRELLMEDRVIRMRPSADAV